MSIARVSIQFSLLSLVAVGACAKSDTPAVDTTAAATAAPAPDTAKPAAAAAPAINDAQIAHIAVTANAIDSTAGALAKTKGSSKAVKDFAQTMVMDHGGVNKQAVALATKLSVTPEDNDVSKQLKTAPIRTSPTSRGSAARRSTRRTSITRLPTTRRFSMRSTRPSSRRPRTPISRRCW